MNEVNTINGPMRLHDEAMFRQGAKQVLINLHDMGLLRLTSYNGKETKDDKVYTEALYKLLIEDNFALLDWLAGVDSIRFYNHERDNKGRLVRCKAKRV